MRPNLRATTSRGKDRGALTAANQPISMGGNFLIDSISRTREAAHSSMNAVCVRAVRGKELSRFSHVVAKPLRSALIAFGILLWSAADQVLSQTIDVRLTEVPDYDWYYGCMGTAAGNLMGFWDRHGFPDFYTGQANGGLAPLTTASTNLGIVSLWASKAGLDGRPAGQPGHVDDYYVAYESTAADPYTTAGRPEHAADCIGDFIGLSQSKWTQLGGECNGNIDGFCYVYWKTNGDRQVNFVPSPVAGVPARDVQSGLRAWTQWRGYDAVVFTQLVDLNPATPPGKGFGFEDLKAEIDTGYPVLLFLQNTNEFSRTIGSAANVNPHIHSMLAYGYYLDQDGTPYVRYRTSWASGDNRLHQWAPGDWEAGLPVRGVIGYHPLARLRQVSFTDGILFLQWDGPAANLYDSTVGATRRVHGYVVETAASLTSLAFTAISPVLITNSFSITNVPDSAFFRIRLVNL